MNKKLLALILVLAAAAPKLAAEGEQDFLALLETLEAPKPAQVDAQAEAKADEVMPEAVTTTPAEAEVAPQAEVQVTPGKLTKAERKAAKAAARLAKNTLPNEKRAARNAAVARFFKKAAELCVPPAIIAGILLVGFRLLGVKTHVASSEVDVDGDGGDYGQHDHATAMTMMPAAPAGGGYPRDTRDPRTAAVGGSAPYSGDRR